MELISSEALIEKIEKRIPHMIPNVLGTHDVTAEGMVEFIKSQPTVEAVPVVHCKDCTHWGTGFAGETEHVKCCEYGKYMVGKNGYCVYGERKENEKTK